MQEYSRIFSLETHESYFIALKPVFGLNFLGIVLKNINFTRMASLVLLLEIQT